MRPLLVRPLLVHSLGRVPYRQAWALQRELAEQRKAGAIEDTLLLLEHDPVITIGRDGQRSHLHLTPEQYATRGIDLVETDRGGDATYHGPGQAIAYPIIDLRPDRKDVRKYVRALEQAMIDTLAAYDIEATRLHPHPGVWLRGPDPDHGIPTDRKIGALGARISRWVTHHGLALNVNNDLAPYDLIVPCGIPDKAVTSLARELGHEVPISDVFAHLANHLAHQLGRRLSD